MAMDTEEQRLRNHPGDFMTTANPMENAVGYFWGILETRTYMRARPAIVEALQRIKTKSSLEAQRDHMRDMLRLSRSDNIGVRYLIPAVLLRLGEDQACYDFAMWYETSGAATDYDWGNMSLPFLDVKNADVFADIDMFRSEYACLHFLAAVTLLKIRLLLDLRDLQNAIDSSTDRSTISLRSTIISGNAEIIARRKYTNLITKLEDQIEELYGLVEDANEFFWPAIRAPERHIRTRPMACSRGSREEMQTAVVCAYEAWFNTSGALEYVMQMSD
jgi:hypothetical protein